MLFCMLFAICQVFFICLILLKAMVTILRTISEITTQSFYLSVWINLSDLYKLLSNEGDTHIYKQQGIHHTHFHGNMPYK